MMLLQEGHIGNLDLRNRTKFASTTTCFCTEEGRVTEREMRWLEERAKGGIGLVTTGIAHVTSWGRLNPHMLGGWDDSFIDDFVKLAAAIHSGGAKACLSVGHCGRYTYRKEELVDASSVATRIMTRAEPHQLTVSEIAGLAKAFGETAGRAKTAGFDAVEVCGCAGYLLAGFLSPWTNRRNDSYGGSLENRARFSLEVVEAIKDQTGKGFPLIFRMCGDELIPEGNRPEDLSRFARMLEEAGTDALSITVGWHESQVPAISGEIPRGHWLYLAKGIKSQVRIPIMMAYRVSHAEAEKAISEGIVDFWEASRPFIADPGIPKKLAENRPEDIIPCICCCQGCYDSVFRGLPIWCVVNPRAGRESDRDYEIHRAETKKKVVIVGAGPAGMETAIVAAKRGHRVTLLEREERMGGNLLAASIPPYKADFKDLITYFQGQIEKAGIGVSTGHEVSPKSREIKDADAVVVATGASPLIPDVRGVQSENVVTALEVLLGKKKAGQHVVVIGGGLVGCETAEYLMDKGKKVTVLEMLDRLARDMGPTLRWRMIARLKAGGVRLLTEVDVLEITESSVLAVSGGEKREFEADTVVLAAGMKSNDTLYHELRDSVPVLCQVGDSLEPRKLGEAIKEGYLTAARC